MSTFDLSFTGLCAFSPGDASKRVVMVRAHTTLQGSGHSRDHEIHVAAFLAPLDKVVKLEDNDKVRDFDFVLERDVYSDETLAGFLLTGEELTLDSLTGNFTLVPGKPDQPCPPKVPTDPDGLWPFRWITNMPPEERAFFNGSTLSDRSKVLAHLLLNAGKLGTVQFAGEEDIIYKWRHEIPDQGSATEPRAIAEVVKLISSFNGNTLRIASTEFSGRQLPDILLTGSGISAWLVNLPIADILGPDDPTEHPAHPHFKHFYKISTNPGGRRFPHHRGECQGDSHGHRAPTNPKCPPVEFTE